MLDTVLNSCRQQIEFLAESWLNSGATSVEIWQADRRLAGWPGAGPARPAGLVAPIQSNGEFLGELRIAGLESELSRVSLQMGALFIARLVELEDELDALSEELGEAQDQLLAFYELTRSTSGHLDIDRLLQALVQQATRLVKAAGAFIVLGPSATQNWPAVIQQPAGQLDDETLVGLFDHIRASGKERLVSVREALGRKPAGLAAGNLFLVPLRRQGGEKKEIVAGLGLWLNRPAAALSPDLKLARSIAEQAGAALEVALLHQEILEQTRMQTEMELAQQVQLRLLPQKAPKVTGLDISARSRPALRVGGDFYDFVTGDRVFSFSVGDVSGKGMSAALLMAMTRTALRSKSRFMPEPRPALIMDRANEDLYDDFTEVGMFATVFVGQFSAQERRLYYANAGHSPVIYCPAGGPAHLLEADGPALGVLPISLSEEYSLILDPGDVLVVATDGFSEARNSADEMFGYERLLRLVESLAQGSADEISQGMFEALRHFCNGRSQGAAASFGNITLGLPHQDDDQTLVVFKGVIP